jgi:two-component system sensor histidine kinase UhpB
VDRGDDDILTGSRAEDWNRLSRFALGAFGASLALWMRDFDTGRLYLSARCVALLGFAPDDAAPGAEFFMPRVHPDDVAAIPDALARHLVDDAPYDIELRLRHRDGSYRWFRSVGSALRDDAGQPRVMAGLLTDIDALKTALDRVETQRGELEATNARLTELSQRLVNVQEDERRHLARELHDEIGQSLTAAILTLEMNADGPLDPADRRAAAEEIRRALGDVRAMTLRLRPPLIDELGLEAALRWYLDKQAAAGKFEAHLSVEGLGRRPPPVIELTAFRLVQEAVTNILRHARARHVDVAIKVTATELALRISEDGVGFDPFAASERAAGGESLGVLGMQERAALAGGRCEIVSTPGMGSVLLARLPLAPRQQ